MIVVALVLMLVITLLPGCSQLVLANSGGYVGASSTAYEDALGATSQLAPGTLNLEGTADAVATGRASVPVELSGVQLVEQGTDYVQIRGTATNSNPFEVKNVTVSAVLLDASGQMVSLGSTHVLQADIEPGASLRSDLRIETTPYVSYRLHAQAERDWE